MLMITESGVLEFSSPLWRVDRPCCHVLEYCLEVIKDSGTRVHHSTVVATLNRPGGSLILVPRASGRPLEGHLSPFEAYALSLLKDSGSRVVLTQKTESKRLGNPSPSMNQKSYGYLHNNTRHKEAKTRPWRVYPLPFM